MGPRFMVSITVDSIKNKYSTQSLRCTLTVSMDRIYVPYFNYTTCVKEKSIAGFDPRWSLS